MGTRSRSKRAGKKIHEGKYQGKVRAKHNRFCEFFNARFDFLVPGSPDPRMSVEHAVFFGRDGKGDTTARKNDCVREDMGKYYVRREYVFRYLCFRK